MDRPSKPPSPQPVEPEQDLILAARRLTPAVLGVVFGLVAGLGILTSTLWLVIKGGPHVGQHLSLLGQFLPGYSVTFPGSVVGLLYGLLLGFAAGWFVARVYNWVLDLKASAR